MKPLGLVPEKETVKTFLILSVLDQPVYSEVSVSLRERVGRLTAGIQTRCMYLERQQLMGSDVNTIIKGNRAPEKQVAPEKCCFLSSGRGSIP